MNGYSKTAGGFILALMVAVAFTGAAPTPPIGIHQDCIDGFDNDGDGPIDDMDGNCYEYPFADGGGESQTTMGPNGKAWASDQGYEMSLFDWHMIVAPHTVRCFQDAVYLQADIESNGEDPSLQQYNEWFSLNCN